MNHKAPTPTQTHREIWERKKVLRLVYGDYYQRISKWCVKGTTLEVGGGSGNFRAQHQGDVVSMDIQYLPWLDLVADAHQLPFADGSFSNIVMVDTLHHLQKVGLFLAEVQRVLRPGGRLVLVEPAISPVSYVVYNYMHPEPVRMDEDPLAITDEKLDPNRDPFDSNQAIPTLLFEQNLERMCKAYPQLRLVTYYRFGLFTFVLSGGLRSWSLLPPFLVPIAIAIENVMTPLLKNFMAFRLLGVMERK